jgi:hypothetical protein
MMWTPAAASSSSLEKVSFSPQPERIAVWPLHPQTTSLKILLNIHREKLLSLGETNDRLKAA